MKIVNARYRLAEEIGSGGEARVYRAHDLVLGGDVALRLASGSYPVRHAGTPLLQHPGWVRQLDQGADSGGRVYQVFELLTGTTLRAQVEKAPLAPEAWRDFVHQSLDAVEALHNAPWAHGDLNADNFIGTSVPVWKLLELPFHRLDAPENRSAVFGSILTLAPEQIDGAPASPLADLYSLGCLYYYAGSGGYPHAGGPAPQLAVDRLLFPPEPLAPKAPGLTEVEARFVMKLLARHPGDRPASVGAARRLLADPR